MVAYSVEENRIPNNKGHDDLKCYR